LRIIFPLGALFSLLGAAMAFLITYGEYSHHFTERREPFRIALRAGIISLLFFCALSLAAGLLLERTIGGR
jgi:hypothetical protein